MAYKFIKLRANVELEGDVELAVREMSFFCKQYQRITTNDVRKLERLTPFSEEIFLSNTRKGHTIGFLTTEKIPVSDLLIKSSFIQEIWTENNHDLKKWENKPFCEVLPSGICCIIPLFAMSELLTYLKTPKISSREIENITKNLANISHDKSIRQLINKSVTSTPHVHGLHKYKAKFFPRLIRMLLLTQSDCSREIKVLDPFVGSGTALIESSFLGFDSIGIDIDKLSCLISESKSDLLIKEPSLIGEEYSKFENIEATKELYEFPSWISKKFIKNNTLDEMNSYQEEISGYLNRLENLNGSKKVFQTIISDALNRKFNIRMMGTGVPRFALEIQKRGISNLINENSRFLLKVSSLLHSLKNDYGIKFKKPKIINGNATATKLPNNSVDLIVTSPPYLPASSGREDYLIGKSISITALGLLTEQEIRAAESISLGSMKNSQEFSQNDLPKEVTELYNWLKNDDLRKIKADPTLAYYRDIKKALAESYRVLKPGGKAIYIIGKESTFYSFKTRKVLFKVNCDKIFEDISISIGFKVIEQLDIELNKRNKNARPRSLDKYFESVFIMAK